MSQEKQVADELKKMFLENRIPTSIQEDINEISEQLSNGKVNLSELEKRDEFVVDIIHQAINRTGHP